MIPSWTSSNLGKKANSINVDSLCAILLMEADFNATMNILIGYCMIQLAQDCGLIPVECFGSHPSCTAIQVSLNCCLMSDTARQTWGSLAIASVDCDACYNSVGHAPASLACQCLGVPP